MANEIEVIDTIIKALTEEEESDLVKDFLTCSQFTDEFKKKYIEQSRQNLLTSIKDLVRSYKAAFSGLIESRKDPSDDDLAEHLDYFEEIIECNRENTPVSEDKQFTRKILREAIIQYVKNDYYLFDNGEILLGGDLGHLIKVNKWSELHLGDTAPRDRVMRIYKELFYKYTNVPIRRDFNGEKLK